MMGLKYSDFAHIFLFTIPYIDKFKRSIQNKYHSKTECDKVSEFHGISCKNAFFSSLSAAVYEPLLN